MAYAASRTQGSPSGGPGRLPREEQPIGRRLGNVVHGQAVAGWRPMMYDTAEPGATLVPGAGDWLMTRPM